MVVGLPATGFSLGLMCCVVGLIDGLILVPWFVSGCMEEGSWWSFRTEFLPKSPFKLESSSSVIVGIEIVTELIPCDVRWV